MNTQTEEFRAFKLAPVPIAVFLVILALIYNKKTKKIKPKISIEEVTEKLLSYKPEPLAVIDEIFVEPRLPLVIENNLSSKLAQSFDKVQNLVSNNYLSLVDNENIKEMAERCIRNNGVGSCGPRGFYGTIDIHLDLECRIAEFMGLEETVLYSYSVSTMSSAIIAYCKKDDVIFCDEKVAFPSIQGIKAAKSTIIYFKHNDPKDLEQKVLKLEKEELNKKTKARRFLLVEGIYFETGTICPLPELMALREKYKMRMFLDECISFGTLGSNGRGVTEHFGVDRSNIDLIVGSLEFGIGSIGGFCVGCSYVIEHQRLSGLGYCFSASLPPFLSTISKYAIDFFESSPETFVRLHKVCRDVHDKLEEIKNITVLSDPLSPKKVFLSNVASVEDVVAKCKDQGVIVHGEGNQVDFNVNIDMEEQYISTLSKIINWAAV